MKDWQIAHIAIRTLIVLVSQVWTCKILPNSIGEAIRMHSIRYVHVAMGEDSRMGILANR